MVYLFINLLTQALLLVFLSFSCIVLQTFAVAENRHFAIFRTAYFPKFVEEDVLLKVKNMNLSSGFS